MSALYIDIGGTHIRGEYSLNGKVVKEEFLTKDYDLIDYIEDRLKLNKSIKKVSIAFAGQVNDGVIISSPNINVRVHNIREYFRDKYNIDLKIDNDLKCALLAHKNIIKEPNMALLYIGTGIGCAVLDNNHIVRGVKNLSCEIGHIPFKDAPFKCGCGKQNCIELFASGSGLEKWLNYYNLPFVNLSNLRDSTQKEAKEIYANFLEGLFRAYATLITLFNPKVVILGGGVIMHNKYLIDEIKNNISKYALKQDILYSAIEITTIKDAPLQGAKLL